MHWFVSPQFFEVSTQLGVDDAAGHVLPSRLVVSRCSRNVKSLRTLVVGPGMRIASRQLCIIPVHVWLHSGRLMIRNMRCQHVSVSLSAVLYLLPSS